MAKKDMRIFRIIALLTFICIFYFNRVSAQIESENIDTSEISRLIRLSTTEKTDSSALVQAQKAYDLSLPAGDNIYKARAAKNLADKYFKKRFYDNAIVFYTSAQEIFEAKNENNSGLFCRYKIALSENARYNYETALKILLDVIERAEKSGNDKICADACHVTARQFYALNDLRNARVFNNKAENIYTRIKSEEGMFNVKNSYGLFFHKEKNYDSALFYFEKAREYAEKSQDSLSLAVTYNNVALINFEKAEYDGYLEAAGKSLEINTKLGNINNMSIAYNNIGYFYFTTKNYKKGIEYLNKCVEISEKNDLKNSLLMAYENLAALYDTLRDFENAYKYQKLFTQTKDQVFSEQRERTISEMNAKYDAGKKEQEITLLKKDAQLRRYFNYSLIMAFSLMLLLAVFFFKQFRNKKRANELLSKKNTEIEQQKEEISTQREELITINEELQNLNNELEKLSVIARETDNAVIVAASDGIFEWVNEAFTKVYGYSLDEVKSETKNLFSDTTNDNFQNILNECIRERKSALYESQNFTKNGEKIWLQTNLVPIFNAEGKVKKIAVVETDISKLKAAEDEISKQRDLLLVKNENINAGIRYAKTIQNTILPSASLMNQFFDSFVLFKPRDIVSGDFYWMFSNEKYTFFALVDCTGHGVPGAFMSLIGSRLLNEIVKEKGIVLPSQILEELNTGVRTALSQDTSENTDGMDIALCRFEKTSNTQAELLYSGSRLSLFLYDSEVKKISRIKQNRKYIGGFGNRNVQSTFSDEKIILTLKNTVYLSSDGFADQNNAKREKFGTERLMNIVADIAEKPFDEQKTILEKTLSDYQENQEQRDDITTVGLRFKFKNA